MAIHGTTLTVSMAHEGVVKVQVFDLMGNAVESRMEHMIAGQSQLSLDRLSRGSYIVRVTSGSEMKTARISIR